MAKPNSSNLTVIKWKNKRGEVERFKLKTSIISKWRDVGNLVAVPWQVLDAWKIEKDAETHCRGGSALSLDEQPSIPISCHLGGSL